MMRSLRLAQESCRWLRAIHTVEATLDKKPFHALSLDRSELPVCRLLCLRIGQKKQRKDYRTDCELLPRCSQRVHTTADLAAWP